MFKIIIKNSMMLHKHSIDRPAMTILPLGYSRPHHKVKVGGAVVHHHHHHHHQFGEHKEHHKKHHRHHHKK